MRITTKQKKHEKKVRLFAGDYVEKRRFGSFKRRLWVRDLDHAGVFARGDAAVGPHLKREPFAPPQFVHEPDQLQRELILAEVVA